MPPPPRRAGLPSTRPRCEPFAAISAGAAVRQRSTTKLQRGAKAQPAIGRFKAGTMPGISASFGRAPAAPPSSSAAAARAAGRACRDAAGVANSSPAVACSTMRPAYMTMTRSQVSATTPRSCVIRMMAEPSFSFSSSIRSRICAWIVTSSAVVGSSAISTCGSQHSAMAIITRWRMPPESWCGYSERRRRASAIRTSSSISRARSQAARRERPRCRCTLSAICVPMVSTGLRLVIGSWKIIAIRRPRSARIASIGQRRQLLAVEA